MKYLILAALIVAASLTSSAWADAPDASPYCQFGWPEGYFAHIKVPPKMEAYDQGLDMSFVYWGEKPADLELQEVDEDFLSQITATHFAIIGRYQCSKIATGTVLEMLCYFTAEKPGDAEMIYSSKTPIITETDNGATGSQWQTFVLPFDATGAKTHLVKIEWKLHLAGGYGSRMGFDQVYLRQYPNGNFAVAAGSSSGAGRLQGDTLDATLPSPIPTLQPAFQVAVSPPDVPVAGTFTAPDPLTIGTLARKGQIIGVIPFDGHYPASTDFPGGRLMTSLLGGAPIANASYSTLVLQYDGKGPAQIPLFTLSGDPLHTQNGSVVGNITSAYYAVVGQIKYENVNERSYLEMWSHFSPVAPGLPGGEYFSRGLQSFGPLGEITGTSDWREFWQPFDATGSNAKLTSLDFNLHLTGPGQVSLRWLKLVQFTSPIWIENDAAALANVSQVVVNVSYASGAVSYRVDNQPCVDRGDLLVKLQNYHKSDPSIVAVIHADKTLPHNEVLFVVATVRDAGIQQVTFDIVSPTPASWRSWSNIVGILSVIGILLLLGVITLLIFLLWRGKERRHERELRRIASLDT